MLCTSRSSMMRLVMTNQDATREWIEAILENLQVTPTELARRAGIAATTLTRFINNPDYPNDLSRRTVESVSRIAGVRPLQKPGERIRGLSSSSESDLYQHGSIASVDLMIQPFLRRNDIEIYNLNSRALEHEGYLPGDVLIVNLLETAMPGDIVCASVQDWKSNQTQIIFRVYEPPFLVAASSDRALRRPLAVDQEIVRIKGVLLGSTRPRRNLAA